MLIKPNQRASLSIAKSGNLDTTALALGFYCLFVSNGVNLGILVYKFYKFNADHLINKIFAKF